ncbi:HAD family hydrolase [Kitasatospora sp. NPDC059795]|uniref:HAD family hydrolase n=1 Tax=Kitasatospora sp. NPDC059795 TaxID=3346949 RepID=UPI00364BA7A4
MRHAVLFDLDGVLLDSRNAYLATLAGYAMAALGRRVTITDLPTGAHLTPRDQALAALGLDGPIHEEAWDSATATAGLRAKPFPFTVGTLTELRAFGVATGLVTLRSRRRVDWLLPPARAGADVLIHQPGGLASALILLTGDRQPNEYAKRS